ncbi:MAG: transporter substrate-binding protein [Betaproteobacteria bacterium]|nr:transporter substrate-binding protein [Betaproteobacteria bacterium]
MKHFYLLLAVSALCLLAACASAPVSPELRTELAPRGTLRAGINYGNVVLATKDPTTGELRGVHVDLARELAKRAGLPIELIGYDSAGAMVDGLKNGALDVALLSAEPARASEIVFSPAYIDIDATYLVPAGSPIRDVADIDQDGKRVAIAAKSAYEFFLSRSLKQAKLVPGPGTFGAYDVFVSGKLDALVGIRPRLVIESEKLPGSRVLAGRFMAIEQTIASPQGRPAAAGYVRRFVEDVKATGVVAAMIAEHRVRGVSVSPPSPSRANALE